MFCLPSIFVVLNTNWHNWWKICCHLIQTEIWNSQRRRWWGVVIGQMASTGSCGFNTSPAMGFEPEFSFYFNVIEYSLGITIALTGPRFSSDMVRCFHQAMLSLQKLSRWEHSTFLKVQIAQVHEIWKMSSGAIGSTEDIICITHQKLEVQQHQFNVTVN